MRASFHPTILSDEKWAKVQASLTKPDGNTIVMSDEQASAVKMLLRHKVAILTGGPGTGKSTVTKALIHALKEGGISPSAILLCSPTGKAAKRAEEATGHTARTVHSTVYRAAIEGRIEAGVVIVDEASMLDIEIVAQLLALCDDNTRIYFIGDPDQLPSVGPGRVLEDLLRAAVPTARLTSVFRQADGSGILDAVYAAGRGEAPPLKEVVGLQVSWEVGDALYIEAFDAAEITRQVVTLYRDLPARLDIAATELRVVVPQHGTGCGTVVLNDRLQAALNPPAAGKVQLAWPNPQVKLDEAKRRVLRVGDILIWTDNNPQLGLVNGSEVEVLNLYENEKKQKMVALVCHDDDRFIEVKFAEVDALHGWAMTTHKAQGSEYRVVVVVASPEHRVATRRNLYTALSRAKGMLVVVGSRYAMAQAVGRNFEADRRTRLAARLTAAAAAGAK